MKRVADKKGASIVNLMASLIAGRGGHSPHASLKALPPAYVASFDRVLLLILDGLGWEQWEEYQETAESSPFFLRHTPHLISTVFPATTASAITTFTTGCAPAEHGVLGWFQWLPAIQSVATVLKCETRDEEPLLEANQNYADILKVPNHLLSMTATRTALSWGNLTASPFGRACGQWDAYERFKRVRRMRLLLNAFSETPAPAYGYAYWPSYDSLCHKFCTRSRPAIQHLVMLDVFLGNLIEDLKGSNTLLLITADHGLVDVRRKNVHELANWADWPRFSPGPPWGDGRQMRIRLYPDHAQQFVQTARDRLGEDFEIEFPPADSKLIGAGLAHPELAERAGDVLLLPPMGHTLSWTAPGQKSHRMSAHHGGRSEREMNVPLFVVEP